MHIVKKVEHLGAYRLRLYFSNREIRIIDLEEDLKNSKNKFIELLDIDFFKKVKCVGDSIAWPNGIDYCPDWLHLNSRRESKSVTRRKTVKPKSSSKRSVKKRRSVAKS